MLKTSIAFWINNWVFYTENPQTKYILNSSITAGSVDPNVWGAVMFFTHTSIVCQHSYLWISFGSNGKLCKYGVTGSQEHLKRLCGVGVCEKDGVWQCWSLCSCSGLVCVPVLSLVGYRENCLPESNDKERSGGWSVAGGSSNISLFG